MQNKKNIHIDKITKADTRTYIHTQIYMYIWVREREKKKRKRDVGNKINGGANKFSVEPKRETPTFWEMSWTKKFSAPFRIYRKF